MNENTAASQCGPRSAEAPAIIAPRARPRAAWRLNVAPMMDWTDRHCRYFHRLLTPHARLYTEMIHSGAILHGNRAQLLEHAERGPVALQLGGCDAADLARAACHGQAAGYAEINLNVCCPSPRVQSGRFGACLMREPAHVAACIRAIRAAVDVPVTAKCRIGVDDQDAYHDLQRFAEATLKAGLDVLAVHARKAWLQGLSPKENRNIPPLDYPRVYRLKQEFPELTVLINGGITTVAGALEHLREVDGVMLGRAAYRDPWILARLEQALFGTPLPERADILYRLRPYLEARLARGLPLKHVLRHVLGLYSGCPNARRFRRTLSEGMQSASATFDLVERALDPVASPA